MLPPIHVLLGKAEINHIDRSVMRRLTNDTVPKLNVAMKKASGVHKLKTLDLSDARVSSAT